MRLSLVSTALISCVLLAGCASAPDEPTLTLETKKSPEQFTACVVPRLQGSALTPVVSQAQRRSRVVVSSSMAADRVIEAYKASNGGRVYVYEHSLLSSGMGQAAKECV